MDRIPAGVADSIKKFIMIIRKDLKIKKVFLFGSYATGKFSEDSDIDLCIIADDVENSFLSTLKIAPKVIDVDLRIEPLVFSWKEYEEDSNFGVLKEIKEKGIEL